MRRRIFTTCCVTTVLFTLLWGVVATKAGATDIPREYRTDLYVLTICRDGLAKVVAFERSRPDIFGRDRGGRAPLLSRQDKLSIWGAWSALLDYIAALDALGYRHGDFYRLSDAMRKRTSFSLRYAAFLAEYRFALEFIALAERNPGLSAVLDDSVPEFGLPKGSYSRIKFRFLNVARATEFAALQTVDRGLSGEDPPEIRSLLQEDSAVIWKMGRGKGPSLTFANGLAIVVRSGFAAWFPVQKGISKWMGDVKVRHEGTSFISQEQIRSLRPRLQPGDILLERREWYLSNLGLPGYWTHVALYIGTEAERRAFFYNHEVRHWVRSQGEKSGDFEALLRDRYPGAYAASTTPERGNPPRVVEAISKGVSFTSLEHSASADSLAVLRPRLSKREKAEAILRAFHYIGRPYDYNFDFHTDSALVCSELLYKVYESGPEMRGLRFPLTGVIGRKLTLPNDMARQFSEQFGAREQQTDFVLFLDGVEKNSSARESDLTEFRRSWQRPKWHVLAQ